MINIDRQQVDVEVERLQEMMSLLEQADGPARAAAQQLLHSVLALHRGALEELLVLIRDAGAQPADTLLPRLSANPRVRSLLLLHDLHPQGAEERLRHALERLRPHLGVRRLRAELDSFDADGGRARIVVAGDVDALSAADVHRIRSEIEDALLELVPDIEDLAIDGLGETDPHREVPLVWAPTEER